MRPQMSTFALILSRAADADVAYLLLVVGLLAVTVEVLHPGGFVAGGLGALLLVASGVILSDLPVNELGLLLIAAGVALLLAEAFLPGGIVGALGLVAVIGGGLTLYDDGSDVRVSRGVLAGVAIGVAGFGLLVLRAIIRTRRALPPPATTTDLLGQVGVVERALDPEGVVRAGGESWTARTHGSIPVGAQVRVVKVDGLTLEVEAIEEGSAR